MVAITNTQIKLLKLMVEREPVIATWNHGDLSWLARRGLVVAHKGFATTGRLSSSSIWYLTEAGRRFLTDERAGQ